MREYDQRKKIVGARIKKEREKLGMSRKELLPKIYKSETSHKTLAAWENGTRLPDLDSIALMAELFDCDIGYLLGDYNERNRVTADICKETGLSEHAAEWICGIHKSDTVGEILSEQLLDALSRLITTEDFSLILKDIAGLKIIEARTQNNAGLTDFCEVLEQLDYRKKVSTDIMEKTRGTYGVFSVKEYIDTLKFRLNKAFNNAIDEIARGNTDNG